MMSTDELIKIITNDISREPYMLSEVDKGQGHFKHGDHLHGDRYYLTKNYMQSADNCKQIADVLVTKLKSIAGESGKCVLIGHKDYIGLLLNIAQQKWSNIVDYGILESNGDNFNWYKEFEKNKIKEKYKNENVKVIVVLPVSCTCITYIRIKTLLKDFDKKYQVQRNFISIFHISNEATIKKVKEATGKKLIIEYIEQAAAEEEKIYQPFNWKSIETENEEGIIVRIGNEGAKGMEEATTTKNNNFTGHLLISLPSKLYPSEECPFCFPAKLQKQEKDGNENKAELPKERIVFRFNDITETADLLKKLPPLAVKEEEKKEKFPHYFVKAFETADLLKKLPLLVKKEENFSHYFLKPGESPLLYGHYKIEATSYMTYIRGKVFYEQNRNEILQFFVRKLKETILKKDGNENITKVIFITSASKFRSSFLEDFVLEYNGELSEKDHSYEQDKENQISFHILKYGMKHEFINNFMTDSKSIIWEEQEDKGSGKQENKTLKIFYEDIVSGARTYKLLSNYVKHYSEKYNEDKNKEDFPKHGFDYIFTLIDRTIPYTYNEILKKLASKTNSEPKKHFISFFRLNVPVVSAYHMSEPLKLKERELKAMIKESHLDALKQQLASRLKKKTGKPLELEKDERKANDINYFPFEKENGNIDATTYLLYQHLTLKNFEMLKLYAAHKVNEYLFDDTNFDIEKITNWVWAEMNKNKEIFFIQKEKWNENPNNKIVGREEKTEKRLLEDEIIKTLTKAPFVYSAEISHKTFEYCLEKVDGIIEQIEYKHKKDKPKENSICTFEQFRSLKFYMRRLVSLDSSFLVSGKMLDVLKILFENNDANSNQNQLGLLNNKLRKAFEDECKFLENELNKLGETYRKLEDEEKEKNKEQERINRELKQPDKEQQEKSKLKSKLGIIKNEIKECKKKIEEYKQKESEKYNAYTDKINYKNTINSNYQYKTEQIKCFHSFVIDCYKESVFKNHYRSIVLEKLLNERLPKLFPKETYDIKKKDGEFIDKESFNSIIKAPYYILIGMIKSENVYLLNNLKNLHKKNLGNSVKIDNLQTYYFAPQKNDPIIVDARKLVENSIFNQEERHKHIKDSVAKMLECIGEINTKSFEKNNQTGNVIEKNTIDILKAIGGIIKPGIEEKEKVNYALCIEYRKTTRGDEKETDDIVYFQAGSNGEKLRSDIKFRTQGLVYNLIKRLTVSEEKTSIGMKGEQSFMAAIRIKDKDDTYKYHSYNDKYNSKKFDDLYQEDINTVDILKDADMALFFRLSELDESKLEYSDIVKDGNNILTGKAVLIITYKIEGNRKLAIGDCKAFMSNEKIRLISLIKNDILEYLNKKIIDNDSFADWLNTREADRHIRTMEHNVLPLFYSTKKHIEGLATCNPETDNIIGLLRFNIMEYYLKSLIPDRNRKNSSITSEDLELISITKDSIKILFKLILEADGMEYNTIEELDEEGNEKYKLDIDEIEGESFQYPKGMYYYILPELFYNIRKNTCKMYPAIPQYSIKYEVQYKRLIITNTYFEEHTNNNSTKRGKEICKQQCAKLKYQIEYSNSDTDKFVQIGLSNKSVQIKKYQVIIFPKNDIISN